MISNLLSAEHVTSALQRTAAKRLMNVDIEAEPGHDRDTDPVGTDNLHGQK